MSGAVKSIGKTFSKVVKTAKRVLPIALAAGAIFFTAGSALGLTPTFGEAIGGTLGKIGVTGKMADVLTGALTQAGIGSAAGAGGALVTGGDPMKAAQIGSAAGLVTGGISGAMGFTDPLKGVASDSRPKDWFGPAEGVPSVAPNPPAVTPAPLGQPEGLPPAPGKGMDPTALQNLSKEMGAPAAAAAKPRGFLDKLMESQAGAGLVAGVGTGLVNYATAGDKAKAEQEAEDRRRRAYGENYGNARGFLTPEQMQYLDTQPKRPAPGERFKADIENVRFRWNPAANTIDRVPA